MTSDQPQDSTAWQDAVALLTDLGLWDESGVSSEASDRPGVHAIIEGLDSSSRSRIGAEAARLDAQLTDMRRSRTKAAKSRDQRLEAAEYAQLLNSAIRPLARVAAACGVESWREQSDPDPSTFQERVGDTKQRDSRSRFGLFRRRNG